jgi:hypothetical protein
MSKIRVLASLSFAFTLLGPVAAGAQDKPTGGAAQAAPAADNRPPWIVACEADMKKHCQTEMNAKGDVRPCLKSHEADLSQSCKDVFLSKYKILELCKEDIDKVCGNPADPRELGKCFNDKQDKLSDKCKNALRAGSKQHAKEEAKAEAKADKAQAKAETKADKAPGKAVKANHKKKATK